MYETHVTVQGRLVADPVVRQGRAGPFTVFRVAQSERRPVRGEPGRWEDSEASYYDVKVFRAMGENAARSLRKGHPVVVNGKLSVRYYPRDEGPSGTAVELEAYSLGHDLRWGCTSYTRNGDLAPSFGGDSPGPDPLGFGDPEHDPYVVREEPAGVAVASGAAEGAEADTGPLLRPDDERAA
ncbi:single-stranded DNA-binding protein [Phycicoccus avicenniae]|uniref:single-stranded DNA-binding protein n=1 Tax=Phycicoccus avicenniae TaxID=2828860 RepID=UPI003D2BB0E8